MRDMDESGAAQPPVAAPFVSERLSVRPEWIDFNGHMNVAFYIRAFDLAFDEVYERIGLDAASVKQGNGSTFAAEMHITYQRELLEGDPLRVTTRLLGFDGKRCHWFQAMYHAKEGYLAATLEWMILYVDMTRRKVAVMPDSLQQTLAEIRDAHARLPLPPEVGRSIGLANKRQ